MTWHSRERDGVNWSNKPLHLKLTCYRNSTVNQADYIDYDPGSDLTNGNGHEFRLTAIES